MFPGIYRSYDGDVRGGEVSVLHNGVGGCVGIEDGHFKYVEAEIAFWLISLSTGPRFNDGRTDFQFTWALPLLPIFPYGRWLSDKDHRAEFGFMVKLPFFSFEKL